MTLRAVPGGWINTDFEQEYQIVKPMIVTERKSKYKHKITMPSLNGSKEKDIIDWCEQTFGPGGRKWRWRFGWIKQDSTFYFKSPKDAMLFTLRWSS